MSCFRIHRTQSLLHIIFETKNGLSSGLNPVWFYVMFFPHQILSPKIFIAFFLFFCNRYIHQNSRCGFCLPLLRREGKNPPPSQAMVPLLSKGGIPQLRLAFSIKIRHLCPETCHLQKRSMEARGQSTTIACGNGPPPYFACGKTGMKSFA